MTPLIRFERRCVQIDSLAIIQRPPPSSSPPKSATSPPPSDSRFEALAEALRSHSLPPPPIPRSDARRATTTLAPQSHIPIVLGPRRGVAAMLASGRGCRHFLARLLRHRSRPQALLSQNPALLLVPVSFMASSCPPIIPEYVVLLPWCRPRFLFPLAAL